MEFGSWLFDRQRHRWGGDGSGGGLLLLQLPSEVDDGVQRIRRRRQWQ
jgi:hypothetical protein